MHLVVSDQEYSEPYRLGRGLVAGPSDYKVMQQPQSAPGY